MIASRATCKATSTNDANQFSQNKCQEQYLFLLEFYVREIISSRLAKLNEMFFVPTTVAFCFLNYRMDEGLQLTPVDPMFEPQAGIAADVEPFYNGRSVLFALSREALSNMYSEFKININVYKKMPSDIKPDVLVGRAQADMTVHFAALRKEAVDLVGYADSTLPNPSKVLDEELPLVFNERVVGALSVYARVSAHGQTIVTGFRQSDGRASDAGSASSFLFQAEDRDCEGQPLGYRCRILDPESCELSGLLSDDGSVRQDCPKTPAARLACVPCRVGSGARVAAPRAAESPLDEACRPIQTSRGPRKPCGKAVVLKVSGLIDVCDEPGRKPQQARLTVVGEDEAARPEDLADPDHDVFVLRIGKKGLVDAGEKSDIQLEMRTPKGPEKRPPLRLETREVQTEDAAAGKKSGKPGKGKKKK